MKERSTVMFEVNREYPCTFTAPGLDFSTADQLAIAWAEAMRAKLGGESLLYRPQKDALEHDHPHLDNYLRRTGVFDASWKVASNGWRGGPVIVAWPDLEHLGEIGDSSRATSLCVLPWGEQANPWLSGMAAKPIGDSRIGPLSLPSITDRAVASAMDDISQINSVNQSLFGRERDVVVSGFLKLHDSGHSFDPKELYAWAIAHGWSGRAAFDLKQVTSEIRAGKRLRFKHEPFRADILEIWEKDGEDDE